MGERDAEYAVEMAIVIAGSHEELRKRLPLSLVVCTIAPLLQDQPGIDGPMMDAYFEMGALDLPIMILPMPVTGTTGPASLFSITPKTFPPSLSTSSRILAAP